MKILFVINRLQIGGAEILVKDILVRLLERGHEVHLYILDSHAGPIELVIREAGIPIFYGRGDPNSVSHVSQLIRHLRNNDYQIIHSHLYPAQLWTVLANKLVSPGAPIITTEHSTYYDRRKRLKFRLLDSIMYPLYTHIVAISVAVETTLSSNYKIKKENISVIPNGINLGKFFKLSPDHRSPEKATINLLAVGRLEHPKNYPLLIRAVSKIPNVKLTIAGEGSLRSQLEEVAKSSECQDRVIFIGNCSNVPEIMHQSDIFVQGSSWEGFGIAAVEAMASGLPVIASRVPGLSEVVTDAGLQFESGNGDQLVNCILKLMRDSALRITLGNAGVERAKMFSIEKTVDSYQELYSLLVRSKSNRGK